MAELLVSNVTAHVLLELAKQGPPGPMGPTGAPGGTAIVVTAGEALGGHRAVLIDASALARYIDSTQVQHLGRLVGVTQSAGVTGDDIPIINFGPITEPSWSWAVNAPVYLGANGLLTQTLPVSGFLQVVGVALSPTSFFVNPREPIALL